MRIVHAGGRSVTSDSDEDLGHSQIALAMHIYTHVLPGDRARREHTRRDRRRSKDNLRVMVPQLAALLAAQAPYPLERAFALVMLTWEPVSGFEPLTCRLQDGCSAN